MKNNEKAFVWTANDFSEEEPKLEKLACRFQNMENTTLFKEAFEAAKLFNTKVKEEKLEELVYAPVIEDIEETVDLNDDPDKNNTADGEGGEEQD
mmetsp:Transcript_44706/g.43311  ORF Transcript_44706/g.43311 Transcript_44706/m.43311 type:complete len:95 (+) Transcript_44706:321-605(+)